MNKELLGILLIFGSTVLLAVPLGRYLATVYRGDKSWTDFLAPFERLRFRIGGIDANRGMTWQQHLVALLAINLVWFVWAMFVLCTQGSLPLNPDHNPSMTPNQAFNTAISFLVNCNLQHYSGESGVTYFSQVFCLMFLQFVTAATGMAACVVVFNALKKGTTEKLGNFYSYFVKSITRVLLPLSLAVALVLVFQGTPMNWQAKAPIVTVQGDSVNVSRGPAAAMIGIKQIGTNGGGFFGVNSAHPLENPTYLTNAVENGAIILIPIAMALAFGFYLGRPKLGWMVFGVMTAGYLLLQVPTVALEMHGNPAISRMGVDQALGSMEGKEVRLGAPASALWAITTTVTSNGSVNAMHDSLTPLSGMNTLLGMMTNAFYGGVGVGFLNFFVFIIVAVFISGLMVGRTPEFLGKKIEAREMKIAILIALLHPLLILTGTAMSAYLYAGNPTEYAGWLANPGYPGFSEMLYEFTSSAANNGSGFEGLGDNTPWWNISTGVVLILARYLPIIGPVAIAGHVGPQEIHPRERRHPARRHRHVWRDGLLRDLDCCSAGLLSGAGAGPAELIKFTAETRSSGVTLANGTRIRKGASDAIRNLSNAAGNAFPQGTADRVKAVASNGGTPLVLSENDRVLGVVELQDIIKPGIQERFARLRAMGIKTVMVTGDNPLTAKFIAEKAGVDDFIAEAKPEDKMQYIRAEQQLGKLVAMMGDGTNDAPALAQADVGVAMNSGTQAAKEAGNMVDLYNDPTKLIEVVEIGKQLLMAWYTHHVFDCQ